jgi:hypothetical protein
MSISFIFFLISFILFISKLETQVKISSSEVMGAAIFFEENIKKEI